MSGDRHRIIFAGDGTAAVAALNYIVGRGDIEVVGLLLHGRENARQADAMRSGAPNATVIEGAEVNTAASHDILQALNANWLISFNYAVILSELTLRIWPNGHAVNLHTGLLPRQRGRYPNFWAIIEGTSGGVSLHAMTAGVDEGALYATREVPTDWSDTAATLYARLQDAALGLLRDCTTPLLDRQLQPVPQEGSFPTRRRADFLALRQIDLDEPTTARNLLNRIRAFTYPEDPGVTFSDDGRRYSVTIKITPMGADR